MEPPDHVQDGLHKEPAQASSHLGLLTARMVLAVLVSPWLGVGFLYGLSHALTGSIFLGGSGASGWTLVLMLALMSVGPTVISLSLSPSLRGLLAAMLASFALIAGILPALELVGPVTENLFPFLDNPPFELALAYALAGTIPIVVALPITGYLNRRRGYIGLLLRISVGALLALMFAMTAPWLRDLEQLNAFSSSNLVAWAVAFAFV